MSEQGSDYQTQPLTLPQDLITSRAEICFHTVDKYYTMDVPVEHEGFLNVTCNLTKLMMFSLALEATIGSELLYLAGHGNDCS